MHKKHRAKIPKHRTLMKRHSSRKSFYILPGKKHNALLHKNNAYNSYNNHIIDKYEVSKQMKHIIRHNHHRPLDTILVKNTKNHIFKKKIVDTLQNHVIDKREAPRRKIDRLKNHKSLLILPKKLSKNYKLDMDFVHQAPFNTTHRKHGIDKSKRKQVLKKHSQQKSFIVIPSWRHFSRLLHKRYGKHDT